MTIPFIGCTGTQYIYHHHLIKELWLLAVEHTPILSFFCKCLNFLKLNKSFPLFYVPNRYVQVSWSVPSLPLACILFPNIVLKNPHISKFSNIYGSRLVSHRVTPDVHLNETFKTSLCMCMILYCPKLITHLLHYLVNNMLTMQIQPMS